MPPAIWLLGVLGRQRRDQAFIRWAFVEPDRLIAIPTGHRWDTVSLPATIGLPLLAAALAGPCAHRLGPVLHDAATALTYWLIAPGPEQPWLDHHPQAHLVPAGEHIKVPNPAPDPDFIDGPAITEPAVVRWAYWPPVTGTLTSGRWLGHSLLDPATLASASHPREAGASPAATAPSAPRTSVPAAGFTATYTSTDLAGARHTPLHLVSHHHSPGQALRWLARLLRARGTPPDRPGQDHCLDPFTDNDAFHRACFHLNNGTPLRIRHRAGRRLITVTVTSNACWPTPPAPPEQPRALRRALLVRSCAAAARRRYLLRAEARERPPYQQ
ncbi:hypothetical protein ACFW1A_23890 [Kitasatospora sp. NPDC058965]|uniref:hypothetical protein n=1 Tax=Kitasatospora sp. NPDC058965 TaxID=3346682 RepID=UPI0036BBE0E4